MSALPPSVPEAGNLEFMVMADLTRLVDRVGFPLFPRPADGELFRDALARRWAEVRPLLSCLASRLDEARAAGRL